MQGLVQYHIYLPTITATGITYYEWGGSDSPNTHNHSVLLSHKTCVSHVSRTTKSTLQYCMIQLPHSFLKHIIYIIFHSVVPILGHIFSMLRMVLQMLDNLFFISSCTYFLAPLISTIKGAAELTKSKSWSNVLPTPSI